MRSAKLKVMLLPGLDGTGDLFSDFVAAAPERVEPIVVPLPHLASYDSLLPAVLASMPAEPCVVLGESFSGPLAVRVAHALRERVIAVVLCNSFIVPPISPLLRFLPWTLLFAMAPPRWVVRMLFVGFGAPARLVDAVRAAIAKTPRPILAARMRALFSLAPLPRVEVPTIIINSRQDRLVRGAHRTIDGPHLLLQTRPAEVWKAILRGIDR